MTSACAAPAHRAFREAGDAPPPVRNGRPSPVPGGAAPGGLGSLVAIAALVLVLVGGAWFLPRGSGTAVPASPPSAVATAPVTSADAAPRSVAASAPTVIDEVLPPR